MVNWSHLPPEIKQHVVKKLDFMSRHAMKSTSHSDRLIVNSTNFELPRVRFGYKGDRCLIVIYTGVEKFLRLEMIKEAYGITVLRSENSWDPKAISSKQLPPTSDLFKLGLLFLKCLLAEKSILIKVMELEIVGDGKQLKNQTSGIMGGAKFRINEIAASNANADIIEEIWDLLAEQRKDFKAFRSLNFNTYEENLEFQMVAETTTLWQGGIEWTYYQSVFYMLTVSPHAQNLFDDLLRNLVSHEDDGTKLAAAHILKPHIDEILPTAREENYSAIRKHTKCGYSNFWMESKNEKALEKYTEKNTKNKKKKGRKLTEKVPEILEGSEDFQNSEDVEISPDDSDDPGNPEDVKNSPEDNTVDSEDPENPDDVRSVSKDSPEDSEFEAAPEDSLDDFKNLQILEDVKNSRNSNIFLFFIFPILGAVVFYWILELSVF